VTITPDDVARLRDELTRLELENAQLSAALAAKSDELVALHKIHG
jgi:hypothetical protein